MIVATLDTRYYHFVAIGEDIDQAREAMRQGCESHKKYCVAKPWEDLKNAVAYVELQPGQCAREGEFLS